MLQGCFLIFVRCLGASKDKNSWFWGGLDMSKNPEFIEMRFLGSTRSKSKSYKFKLKQHNMMELLNISFPQIYHTNGPQIAQNVKHVGSSGFFIGNRIF